MIAPIVLVAGGSALFLGVFGGLMTPIDRWYHDLRKPSLQPPNWLFGPAWTTILALWAWSMVLSWNSAADGVARRNVIILFAVNALCHAIWSPLFFKLRRPDWALIEVVFLWASLAALMFGLWPINPFAAKLILPYWAWVSFAWWLNGAIVRLNGPWGGSHSRDAR